MNITVCIPTPLRRFTDGAEKVICSAATLTELFGDLEQRFPKLGLHLRDASGQIRSFLNVYVNEEDIRFLGGMNYVFQEGDEVLLVPSIAGGSPAGEVAVRVPATSANLGCAFDCAALALDLYLRASVTRTEAQGFSIEYQGPHAERVPTDETNLVVQGVRKLAAWAGREVRGGYLRIESEIPVGAGLGSSAAAIVAGLLMGARLCGVTPDVPTRLRLAVEIEGHPDNVAAAYHGGLVFAARTENPAQVLAYKTRVPSDLRFVAVIPDFALPTEKSRAVLPEYYSRHDAVHNLQRAALLAAVSFSGKHDLFPELFRDRLHQPYRSRLIPGLEECFEAQHAGLLGIFLSGAGPTVLAVARRSARDIGELLVEKFRQHGVSSRYLVLKAENRGAQVESASVKGASKKAAGKPPAGLRQARVISSGTPR
jgi:homoserine kinase